jgi:hypothetical protein
MATHRVVLTYEDYPAMPDDGRRYEILDGEVAVTATPVTLHQIIVGNLYGAVRGHVHGRGLGRIYLAPFTVVLANTTVVEPDLVYVDNARAGLVTELDGAGYRPAGRVHGDARTALPPFPDRILGVDELWQP